MALAVVTSDRFADHITPPGHPERVERAEAMQVVASRWQDGGGVILAPRAAADEDLVRVHDPAYVQSLVETRGRTSMLDPDTFTSPESEEVGRLAAGAVLTGIDYVMDDETGRRAFVMVRPPGHHAEAGRGMGFCLYNSIAVGAAYARARGLSRVAVIDYDVHHGNGTQWMFYDNPSVLFVSSHQFPFYPGTGAATDTGRGEGLGTTVNLPLDAGAGDADYDSRVSRGMRAHRGAPAAAGAGVCRVRCARARPARGNAHDDGGLCAGDGPPPADRRCRVRRSSGVRHRGWL